MQDIERQIQVLNSIINATDEEIHNINFLLDKINEFGITPLAWLKELDTSPIYTENGMIQVPGEFANFCLYLLDKNIHTAIEIGVFRGRSSYFMCAILYRSCPDLVYNMVDIADYLDGFEEFQKVLPCLKKCIPNTSDDYKGKQFDLVFIDADHSYEGAMRDFLNVGQYAGKLVCFHDIYAHEYDSQDGGTVRMWNEICSMTPNLPKLIFSQFPNRWMGIGVVLNTSADKPFITEPDTYDIIIKNKDLFLQSVKNYDCLYVYGARNDSRRMYKALKKAGYCVEGLVIREDSENPEKVNNIPIVNLKDIIEGEKIGIVLCYRPALRKGVLENFESCREKLIVCDDTIASFITE